MLALHVVGKVKVFGFELGRRLDRVMRFMGPHRQQERLRRVAMLLQPGARLLDDQRRGIAFERADRLPIANKIAGVLVAGSRVVLRRQPPVVAMIVRLRLSRLVKVSVEMPLANMTRRIAALLEQLRQCDLAGSQMNLAIFRNPGEDAVSIWRPPGENRRPRRTAHRTRRITLSESGPLLRERIEIRRLNDRMPATT